MKSQKQKISSAEKFSGENLVKAKNILKTISLAMSEFEETFTLVFDEDNNEVVVKNVDEVDNIVKKIGSLLDNLSIILMSAVGHAFNVDSTKPMNVIVKLMDENDISDRILRRLTPYKTKTTRVRTIGFLRFYIIICNYTRRFCSCQIYF